MSEPRTGSSAYPPIADYGFIGDCHSVALISREGSIDWCCMPRLDAASVFGRLLDWDKGGYCRVAPAGDFRASRRYLEDTLVLETIFQTERGRVRLLDCFAMREGGATDPHLQLIRLAQGVRGEVEMRTDILARFDYGEIRPWVRRHGDGLFSAIGGNDGLVIWTDGTLEATDGHDLSGPATLSEGDSLRLSIAFVRPHEIDPDPPEGFRPREIDKRVDETIEWWRRWAGQGRTDGAGAGAGDDPHVRRSAIVLKGLVHAPTGAIAAAATTSLPEDPGGSRNWDYRFSWIRDSTLAVRSLAELGHEAEADGFRRFSQRSSAGHADELQIVYGVGGERRLTELVLDHLEGYRGARPVRIGNAAAEQFQADVYGELVNLAWRWHVRGHSPGDDDWTFLAELADCAARRWKEPDQGLWETRSEPRHYVHSEVMCWAALECALRLAEETSRPAPSERWGETRDRIRQAVESEGYDPDRGVFVQAFGSREVDAALLLLPIVDFVDYDDERMIRTVDAIQEDLGENGFLRRYRSDDGVDGEDEVFLACSFWLAECLARQGRQKEAGEAFDRACAAANDLGLFSEEFDPRTGEMLGNFPQGLTHLSHIAAAVAMAGGGEASPNPGDVAQ